MWIASRNSSRRSEETPGGWLGVGDVGRHGAGQETERLEILLASRPDDSFGKLGRRRTLVPAGRLEPVAHELLVEGGGTAARGVVLRVPVSRGVGRERLIDPDQASVLLAAEFELGVG